MIAIKKIGSIALTGVLLCTLSACSPSSNDACTPLAKENGAAVSSVKVGLGAAGTTPTATFPTPIIAPEPEVKVLKGGSGQKLLPGMAYQAEIVVFNGKTGEQVGSTAFNGSNPVTSAVDPRADFGYFSSVFQCAQSGSRIVAVIPADRLIGVKGEDLTSGDSSMSLVVIAEFTQVALGKANGAEQPLVEGLPSVKLADNGAPTVTIPATAAPADLKVAVLKKGTGPVVSATSTVIVHYTGVLWDGGTVFDSSWSRNQTASFAVSAVIPGFSQALTGQTVGSQILAVIPPALAYGVTGAGSAVPPNATLVFVVDILGIAK